MAQTNLIDLWRKAAQEEIGLYIETPTPKELREQLYRVRSDANELALSNLAIAHTAKGHIFIVKKATEIDS